MIQLFPPVDDITTYMSLKNVKKYNKNGQEIPPSLHIFLNKGSTCII